MPSRSLPLSVLQQIDQVCDSFEAAWNAGVRPRIEDYLDASTIQERTELFRELLAREIELRKKAGESPDLAEYLGRFGFYGDLIGTVINNHGPGGDTLLLPDHPHGDGFPGRAGRIPRDDHSRHHGLSRTNVGS